MRIVAKSAIAAILLTVKVCAQCPPCANQTSTLTVPLPEDSLPYTVKLELADFTLPVGIQSCAVAQYKGNWLFVAGRINGLHNVDNTDPNSNSFPVSMQNTTVYVIDPRTGTSYSRSLHDPSSNLTQEQIDLLSVTNSLYFQTQNKTTLYVVGGYGINTATQQMETKSSLAAINVPGLIDWVKNGSQSAASYIRFTTHPLLKLTGGVMLQTDEHQPYLLAFGQDFSGNYTTSSDGSYSCQIRPIQIIDKGTSVYVNPYPQPDPNPYYRRRDLNVIPVVRKINNALVMSYAGLSGVFTPYSDDNPGAWTVPINIDANGSSQMLDVSDPNTFMQAMNNYNCANLGLYSQKTNTTYTLLFGGISAAIFSDGSNCNEGSDPQQNCCTAWLPASGTVFSPCCNLPFTNDITTISIDGNGVYRQYIMNETYPTVRYTPPACPGYTPPADTHLFFGANAVFIPNENLPVYRNGVIALENLQSPTFVGYIVGGIASVITDTNCPTDSQASEFVFKVTIIPK